MARPPQDSGLTPEEIKARRRAAKQSGQDRIAFNLFARWAGQLVVIVSGFVIPRLIDDSLGPEALGVWDFAWSTVSYYRFMGFGLSGGLNRFVALYSAQQDTAKLVSAVSSTYVLQAGVALLVTAASAVMAMFLPLIFHELTPQEVEQSQWVVFFLGANLAVRMLFWPSRSVLTGYHQWALTAAVTAVGDIVLLIAMTVVLKTGGSIGDLGLTVFLNAVVFELIRQYMSSRVYPHPAIVRSAIDWATMKQMIGFGVTNSVTGLPNIVAIQTTSIALGATAGPAALAVYARPLALFNHIDHLVKLYAFLLTPVAASLQGLKREADLKPVLLQAMMSSIAMTLPPLLLLAGYGDVIVAVWMGPDYVIPVLAPILGCAFLLPYANSSAMRILVGVDAHTSTALRSLLVTAVVLAIAITAVSLIGWSPATAGIVIGAAMICGPGLVVLHGALKRFDVSLREYVVTAVLPPLACNGIWLALIVISRLVDRDLTFAEAAAWSLAGGASVIVLYWKYLLTDGMRERVTRRLLLRGRRRPDAAK